jgi:hypothetical protein
VDTEQIRSEMRVTRASIDRKLDVLAGRAAEARHDAIRRAGAGLVVASAALFGVWWWRARRTAVSPVSVLAS